MKDKYYFSVALVTKCVTFLMGISIFAACSHKDNDYCPPYDPGDLAPGPTTVLEIRLHGRPLSSDTLSLVKMSYQLNGTKEYVGDLYVVNDAMAGKYLLRTYNARDLSRLSDVKNFYLEYPYGLPTDSLYINYSGPSPQTLCQLLEQPLMYNNLPALKDSTTISTGFFPYIIEKP
jgi:hypothetical protein